VVTNNIHNHGGQGRRGLSKCRRIFCSPNCTFFSPSEDKLIGLTFFSARTNSLSTIGHLIHTVALNRAFLVKLCIAFLLNTV